MDTYRFVKQLFINLGLSIIVKKDTGLQEDQKFDTLLHLTHVCLYVLVM